MWEPRTRLLFDSIMLRLVPFHDALCVKYGQRIVDALICACVDMLILRVEGLRERYKSSKPFWIRLAAAAGVEWKTFKALETDILKAIKFNLYIEGVDAEYEDGEISLWVRHGFIKG